MPANFEMIKTLYSSENLSEPAIMSWPLDSITQKRLGEREKLFIESTNSDLPPDLSWITNHAPVKYRPDRILPGCRSVLVSSLNYFREDEIDRLPAKDHSAAGTPAGKIARYARGRDYHKELGYRLKRIARKLGDMLPGEKFKSFTDIGPLDEVWLIEASGAGFRGHHGLAILPNVGSWVVLGHILTTLPYMESPVLPSFPSCPDGCRRCIDACPNNALESPGRMNPSRCISYQTIEHKGALGEEDKKNVNNWIFGCDICQEVCPFNAHAQETTVEGFMRNYAGPSLNLIDILKMKTKEDAVQILAGSPLMRVGRTGIVRNACIVAGNIGGSTLIPVLESLLDDEDSTVKNHALWALERVCQ